MRPNQQNNNKNRSRGRNGGRKHVNPLSRNFESNGPDVKVRGNAAHVAEKYLQLARDAQSSGDSVMAENYLQHAEHYFRIVSAAQQQQSGLPGRDGDDDYDDDMPELNSRFSSPQPQQPQNQNDQDDGGDNQPSQQPQQQQQNPDRPSPRERAMIQAQLREQQAAEAAAAAAAAAVAGDDAEPAPPVEADGEVRKPRERRPRRRRPVTGEAGGDPASEPQPDVGELPAFITAGGTAAE